MNIKVLYSTVAIVSTMGIVGALLNGNTVAAAWALSSAISSAGAIYLQATIDNHNSRAHYIDPKKTHMTFDPRESEH